MSGATSREYTGVGRRRRIIEVDRLRRGESATASVDGSRPGRARPDRSRRRIARAQADAEQTEEGWSFIGWIARAGPARRAERTGGANSVEVEAFNTGRR